MSCRVWCVLLLFWSENLLNDVDFLNWELHITEGPSKANHASLSDVSLPCIHLHFSLVYEWFNSVLTYVSGINAIVYSQTGVCSSVSSDLFHR